jgi:lipopolysaccharide/colanic/teichoic acid biosynthesis glycosyltransferase
VTDGLPAPRDGRLPLERRIAGAIAGNGTLRRLAMRIPVLRDVAWRYVAGEDLDAGLAAVRELNARGVKATLSFVGTHVRRHADAIAAADELVAAVTAIRAENLDSHLSIKLTQTGLDLDAGLCRAQLRRILDRASEADVFVRIDMEESRYVEATLDLFEEMRDMYGPERVGVVVQSYLRYRHGDLARLAAAGSRIRLVKGGYWESGEVVLHRRRDIDRAFLADIDRLMRDASSPAIATHDPAAIEHALHAAAATGRGRDAFELQMLYGVRPDLQRLLVREGYTVRCYVPYGGQWLPYVLGCLRRIPGGIVRGAGARSAWPSHSRLAGSRGLRLAAKRGLDVAVAGAAIVALAPLLAWTALAVRVAMGPPILFRQERPGRRGRMFTILKFRTMRPVGPGEAWFGRDADRVTRFGSLLRATSIDELPELWNVLRGDMSLVGPRPLLAEYLPHYTSREQRRHEMRPGITGWAAIHGRHTLPFEDRLELDAWYVEHWSLRLDLRILVTTIRQVVGRQGVRATQDPERIDFPVRFMTGLPVGPAIALDESGNVDPGLAAAPELR